MRNKIPRRNQLDKNFPAEKAVYEAMQKVEELDANVKLTEAVIHLQKAKELLADHFDEIVRKRNIAGSLYRSHPLDDF